MSKVIIKPEAFALLLEACPDARNEWEEHLLECEGEDMPYMGMAVFARHLVELANQEKTESFPAVFRVIEQLIVEGDEEVRGLAVVGLLESIQNNASWTESGDKVFLQWLHPTSRAAWRELEELWSGESSLAGVIRKVRGRK